MGSSTLFLSCDPILRVIGQFTREAKCSRGEHKSVVNLNWAFKRNVQVATAGEDEEDLGVVDGQQRTASRDDEHGCALNTAWFALLVLQKKNRWKNVNKYIRLFEVQAFKVELSPSCCFEIV